MGVFDETINAVETVPSIYEQTDLYGPEEVPAEDQEGPGFKQNFGNAWDLYGTVPAIGRAIDTAGMAYDPSFKLSDSLESLMEGVPEFAQEDVLDSIGQSGSLEEAEYRRERTMEELQRKNELNSAGTAGLLTSLLAGVVDPGNIVLALTTGGLGTAYRAGRMATAVRTAAIGAAEGALFETGIHLTSETSRPEDIMYGALFGGVLGGGIGAITGKLPPSRATPGSPNALTNGTVDAAKALEDTDRAIMHDAMGRPASKPTGTAAEILDDANGRNDLYLDGLETSRRMKGETSVSEMDAVEAPPTFGDDSAGAASTGSGADDLTKYKWAPEEEEQFFADMPRAAMTGGQWNISAQLADSPNNRARGLGQMMLGNGVGNVDHAVNKFAAEELASEFHEVATATYARGWKAEYGTWRDEQGINAVQGAMPEMQWRFHTAVGHAVRTGEGSPAELAGAKAFSESLEYIVNQAKKGGVLPDDFQHSADYFPRLINREVMDDWSRNLTYSKVAGGGDGVGEELIRRALKSANPDMDDALSLRIAKVYINDGRRRAVGGGGTLGDLGSKNADEVTDNLRSMGLAEEDISVVDKLMRKSGSEQGDTVARAKSRLLMDLDVTLPGVTSKETGEQFTAKLSDMFVHDAQAALHSYSKSVGGWGAIGQATRDTPMHIKSATDWKDAMSRITAEEVGLPKRKGKRVQSLVQRTFRPSKVEGDIDILELAKNHITGVPEGDPDSFFNRQLRRVSAYNYASDMGNVWTAQTAEWGAAASAGGLKNMIQHWPGFKSLVKNMATGKTNSHLANVMELASGTGTGRLRNSASLRGFDNDLGNTMDAAGRIDQALHKAGEVTGYLNARMMEPQQRVVMTSFMQDFADVAQGNTVGRLSPKRLAGLGLSKGMANRISKQMNKFATTSEGSHLNNGSKLHDPGFNNWTDLDARDALLHAARRKTRRAVQENDLGSMFAAQLHYPLVRAITQFRTFVMGAWPKQLLNNIHMRDAESANMVMWSTFMAAVGNAARIAVVNAGKEDMDERMEKALDPTDFAKSTLARTAYMSILPGLIDTGSQFVTGDPFFSQYRSTGLSSTPLTGNPTYRRATAAYKLGSGLLQSAISQDYSFSRQDWRNARSLMLFNTVPGISNALNWVGDSLDIPKTSKGGK